MNKKYIFIGLGLAVVAGVGFMIWKSSKKDEESSSSTKSVKTPDVPSPPTPASLGVRSRIKTAVLAKKMAVSENKVSFAEEVEVEINPVQMIPDRRWLERSWADVS
jgi:hypothetical protein